MGTISKDIFRWPSVSGHIHGHCSSVLGRRGLLPRQLGPEIASEVNDFLRWLTRTGAPVFDTVADAVLTFLLLLEDALRWLPWPTVVWALRCSPGGPRVGGLGHSP